MPRLVSSAMHRELNAIESVHALVWLFELNITGAPVPFRVANYPETIVFHGFEFLPFGVDVDSLEDASSMALVHLRCAFQAVDSQMMSLAENYWVYPNLWTCLVWQVDALQPNEVLYSDAWVYSVAQLVMQWTDAVADLVAEGITLGSTLPKRRYTSLSGFGEIPQRIGF